MTRDTVLIDTPALAATSSMVRARVFRRRVRRAASRPAPACFVVFTRCSRWGRDRLVPAFGNDSAVCPHIPLHWPFRSRCEVASRSSNDTSQLDAADFHDRCNSSFFAVQIEHWRCRRGRRALVSWCGATATLAVGTRLTLIIENATEDSAVIQRARAAMVSTLLRTKGGP